RCCLRPPRLHPRTASLPRPLSLFQRRAPPRPLHSFPTRRSSDLAAQPAGRTDPRPASPPRTALAAEGRGRGTTGSPTPSWGAMRSEEHTSELQSLTNLVCRLLLEKKKTKQQHHRPRAASSATQPH